MRLKNLLRLGFGYSDDSSNTFPSSGLEPWQIPHSAQATREDIYYCFRLLLDRSPHREEWAGHVAQAGIASLDDVVKSYMQSLEFSVRAGKLNQSVLSDGLSLVALDRFSIYAQSGDMAVGKHLKSGAYEPHVSEIFRQRLRPGMQVLDIGANIGYFTLLAADLVTRSGSVMAIEPNDANVKLLEMSRRVNQFEQVTVLQAAAGRAIGLLVLNTAYSNGTTSDLGMQADHLLNVTTVPSLPIDCLIGAERMIDFIKIDVEGAEYNALLGAQQLLRRCHPVIVSEFSPDLMPGISGINGNGYLRFLVDLGYVISVIELDGTITACDRDIGRVMNAYSASGVDHIDILLS